jgi:hypothetical protein
VSVAVRRGLPMRARCKEMGLTSEVERAPIQNRKVGGSTLPLATSPTSVSAGRPPLFPTLMRRDCSRLPPHGHDRPLDGARGCTRRSSAADGIGHRVLRCPAPAPGVYRSLRMRWVAVGLRHGELRTWEGARSPRGLDAPWYPVVLPSRRRVTCGGVGMTATITQDARELPAVQEIAVEGYIYLPPRRVPQES